MKIEFEQREYIYLANMIQATVANLKHYVDTYEKLAELRGKFTSDATVSFINLSPNERESVLMIGLQALTVLNQTDESLEENAPEERKEHLKMVRTLLEGIVGKVKGPTEVAPL